MIFKVLISSLRAVGRRASKLDILAVMILRTSYCEPLVWFFFKGKYFSFPGYTLSIGIHTILALALLLSVWSPGKGLQGISPTGSVPTVFVC